MVGLLQEHRIEPSQAANSSHSVVNMLLLEDLLVIKRDVFLLTCLYYKCLCWGFVMNYVFQ